MKLNERKSAIKLRMQGWGINYIAKELKVSKGSVSLWVRNTPVKTTQEVGQQKDLLFKLLVEKRRGTRIKREEQKRNQVIQKAITDVNSTSANDLFLIGIALYWGEGSKTRRGIVEFVNSDPLLIKIMMKFFKKICLVKPERFRGHIHLHHHLDIKKAELYWHDISGIPRSQFFKTSQSINKASQNKKDSLPYGTFSIYVCDTNLFLKIKGWMMGMSRSLKIDS